MTRDYDYKGHKYWVTVEQVIDSTTKKTSFFAYVSDQKPGLLLGSLVKDHNGNVVPFEDTTRAFIYAQDIKRSEIDSKA